MGPTYRLATIQADHLPAVGRHSNVHGSAVVMLARFPPEDVEPVEHRCPIGSMRTRDYE